MARPPSQRVIKYAAARGLTPSQLSPTQYAAARGHAFTPEHGKILPRQKHQQFPGRDIYSTYSDKVAIQTINRAANDGARVVVKVHTVNGWHVAGGPRGYSASYVAELTGKAGGLRPVAVYEFGRGGDEYDMPKYEDAIDAWQIDVLETPF